MADALVATGITKKFGKKTAVHNLDLNVHSGEIMGLLGPNGAGKTTTIKLLCGLLRADAGSIFFDGKPLRRFSDVAGTVGVLIESTFPGYLSGDQALLMLARLRGIPTPESDVSRVLDFVDLQGAKQMQVANYSFGMKIRLGLAAALLGNPRLLILDEPTLGLDPQGQADFIERLRLFRKEGGAILFSSHRLEEIRDVCDRVTFIRNGELQLSATTAELSRTDEICLLVRPAKKLLTMKFPFAVHSGRKGDGGLLRVRRSKLPRAITELTRAGLKVVDIRDGQSALWRMFQEETPQ